MNQATFAELVRESWSKAVAIASSNLETYRDELVAALSAGNGEIRSAAVASLYEADDEESHDQVIRLLNDTDPTVRREVAEYLTEYGVSGDEERVYAALASHAELTFLLSTALASLTGRFEGIMEDDAPAELRKEQLAAWRQFLDKKK